MDLRLAGTDETVNERQVGIGLSLAFLALISIGIGVGYFGVSSMRTLLADTRAITENEWGDLRLAEEAFDVSNQNGHLNVLILESTDARELDTLLLRRDENSSRITAVLDRLKPRVNSEKEQDLLNAVLATRAAYTESYEQTTNLLLKRKNRRLAQEMWTKATFPLFLRYHLAWSEFVEFQTEEMDVRLRKGTARYVTALDMTIRFWVSGTLLAIGIAVFVVWRVGAETKRRRKAEADILAVSERTRVAEELAASRQMLQSILDAIPQRVFWKDKNCTYLGCNRPFATDAGLDRPAEIVGKNDFDLAWAQVAEVYRADDKLVMAEGSAKLNFHERQTRPDGSVLWLQTNKLPLRDHDGNVVGVLGTYEDITARRHAEKELRLTKASLENASVAVFWTDRQARIVYANETARLSLGYSREALTSLSIRDISSQFSEAAWNASWEECKARGSITFENQHKSNDGRVFPVEVTANYVEFDGQEFMFAFARDLTEKRELESQLRQAQKLEGIGQLAAGIAHEINTPTQFVADNLTFLRDSWKAIHHLLELYRATIRSAPETPSPEIKDAERGCDLEFIVAEVPRAIDQSLDGAGRVAKIVRAMREFAHPDSADKTVTDLNKCVESTITVARNEWKYVADLVIELDETLPPVSCYPGDINQVILNVLVNAAQAIKEKVKEGEKGQITVRTRRRDRLAEISVRDTGPGIPEAARTRVFDPFFTTKPVGKGTGQGLSLAYTLIVKKHRGKIWFETEIGCGTTFFIDLPIEESSSMGEN